MFVGEDDICELHWEFVQEEDWMVSNVVKETSACDCRVPAKLRFAFAFEPCSDIALHIATLFGQLMYRRKKAFL